MLSGILKDILFNFIFKNFKAEFIKRADTDVHFRCEQVAQINALIEKARTTGERVDAGFPGTAVSAKDSSVVFMNYELNISLKQSKASVF